MRTFTSVEEAIAIFRIPDHPDWHAAHGFLLDHPSTKDQMQEAGRLALQRVYGFRLNDLPAYRDDAGNRVFDLTDLAEAMGVSEDDLIRTAREMERDTGQPLLREATARREQ